MPSSSRASERVMLLTGLLVAVVAVLSAQSTHGLRSLSLPMHDFVEYWAAGRLLAHGENPYDPERIAELERLAGRDEEAILMWNPPWSLPLVVPFGMLSPQTGRLVWFVVQMLVLIGAVAGLYRLYNGPDWGLPITLLAALLFAPTLSALLIGQISPLLPLGALGFLYFVRRGNDLGAGAATVLLSVKPQLCYLFWIAVLLWVIQTGRWRVIAGGILAGVVLTLVAMLFNPAVVGHYFHTLLTRPPSQYHSPTWGTLLRLALGQQGGFGYQFVPMGVGLAWFVWSWPRLRHLDWRETMPPLLLASFITAAYGAWLFDVVLLFVPFAQLAAFAARELTLRRQLAVVVGYAIVAAFLIGLLCVGTTYLAFIWLPPLMALTWLLLGVRESRGVS